MTTPSRTARIGTSVVAALAVTFGLAACGGGGDRPPDAGGGTSVEVALFRYQPDKVQVKVGSTVTWRNGDAILHTVTAGVPGQPSGQFDGEMADKGATTSVTFHEAGTFRYFCTRHPEAMRGEVTVA